ncbi:MAG: oxygenase MpaB family protein [Rhodothermus sp.]|nr:oxygenase MpaB family protein [Rhodothermus sp.]
MQESISIAWQVNRERVVVLGWGRALFWQLAHPLIAIAVAQHSDFSRSLRAAWRRFTRTVQAMRRLSFGTATEAEQVAQWIRQAHQRVRGTLTEPLGIFPTGTTYRADDPALLTWVHVTTIEATLCAYETFVRPLMPDERDRYCQEARAMETWLGLPPGTFPNSWTELMAHVQTIQASNVLRVTPTARRLAAHVLAPVRWAAPFTKPWRVLTLGLLPPELRAAYGFAWTTREEAAFQKLVAIIRRSVAGMPVWIRMWPEARQVMSGDKQLAV